MQKKIKGLTSEEVVSSRMRHGDNRLEKEKTKGFIRRFFENLNDPIIKILILALAIEVIFTFGKCNFFEVFGIIAAILLATTVSTVSEYGSERAFARMQEADGGALFRVLRDGNIIEVSAEELVVGDSVYLSAGEMIPADGALIQGVLRVDQSALNGESREASKSADAVPSDSWELGDRCLVFRGSVIASGNAVMKVMRVGKNTFYGMVAHDVQTETRVSPLKLRLSRLASDISRIGYVMAALVAVTYLFNTFIADNGFVIERIAASVRDIPFLFKTLVHALTLMITVVVVAAPEGLPMMITVVLSANMKRMTADGVLVKKLVGIETAGSMNILFTDKTGTLTGGRPTLDSIIGIDEKYKTLSSLKRAPELYERLLISGRLNTDAELSASGVIGGNGTDRAILEFFAGCEAPRASVKGKVPFTSERKFSSVTLSDGRSFIKGAPERLISMCEQGMDRNGVTAPLDRRAVLQEYNHAAKEGKRIIAVCESVEGGMVFLALLVLKDKVRKGVRDSVLGVRRAGVQVVMLTGDGKETASAIARECGIIEDPARELVLTSSELEVMSDEELKESLPRIAVIARALPQDKTRLVRVSQELDLVVGMTGDGINDAPSLKLADVGFAMGSGAEIAKSAGDVIIVDNSFFAINKTILYGRTIFKSIRKFITFQLIMNFAACGISIFGQFLGIDNPITIIQMLWVNIIMDTLGGLAFAGEAPLECYMKEKPKKRKEPILSRDMLCQILFTGSYTLIMCIMLLRLDFFRVHFRCSDGDICLLTAFYAFFIFAGIFNSFGARCERMWIFSSIGKNKPFVFIMLFISVIQILMIYFGGSIFRTVPLLASELIYSILLASTVLPFEMFRRIFFKLSAKSK